MSAHTDDAEDASLDLDAIKQQLLDTKSQLELDLKIKSSEIQEEGDDLAQDAGGPGNHAADEASDEAETQTEMALQAEGQQELDLVNSALARIANGAYGTCANCGKKIPAARLKARPFAMYDIACQELADQGKL